MPAWSLRIAVALLVIQLAPGALACSWSTPERSDVTWTETGLFFLRREALVHGEPADHDTIAQLGPFSSYRAAPNGTTVYYSRSLGGVGGDCSVELRTVERWTPEGVENLTDLLPGLPMDVHWPTLRGVYANGTNATIVDLRTGETLSTLRPAQESGIISYRGYGETPLYNAWWSPTGDVVAAQTENEVWLFRPDGRYVYDTFPSFPVRSFPTLVAFSPDGQSMAIAWSQGDRFNEVRVLGFGRSDGIEYRAGHVDVRAARAMAYGPDGRLAVAFQEHPLFYGDDGRSNASVVLFDAQLRPLAEKAWPGKDVQDSLSWSPDGDAFAVIVNERIEKVQVADLLASPAPATPSPPGTGVPPSREDGTAPRAIPWGGALLAVAGALMVRRRR